MGDRAAHPASDEDGAAMPANASAPGAPQWVKVFGIVVAVLVLLFVVLKLTGAGGEHGPGRHGGGGAPPEVTEDGSHTPPPGMDHGGP